MFIPDHNPQVYVVSLGAYNNGIDHGEWFDASKYYLDYLIEEFLKSSPIPNDEEWAIHGYEDMPDLGANPDLDRVIEIAIAVEKYGDPFLEYIKHYEEIDKYEDRYKGQFRSKLAFAWNYAGENMEIPKKLAAYINYEAIADDLFSSNYVFHDGYVFTN